jgi:hypothetical protein
MKNGLASSRAMSREELELALKVYRASAGSAISTVEPEVEL